MKINFWVRILCITTIVTAQVYADTPAERATKAVKLVDDLDIECFRAFNTRSPNLPLYEDKAQQISLHLPKVDRTLPLATQEQRDALLKIAMQQAIYLQRGHKSLLKDPKLVAEKDRTPNHYILYWVQLLTLNLLEQSEIGFTNINALRGYETLFSKSGIGVDLDTLYSWFQGLLTENNIGLATRMEGRVEKLDPQIKELKHTTFQLIDAERAQNKARLIHNLAKGFLPSVEVNVLIDYRKGKKSLTLKEVDAMRAQLNSHKSISLSEDEIDMLASHQIDDLQFGNILSLKAADGTIKKIVYTSTYLGFSITHSPAVRLPDSPDGTERYVVIQIPTFQDGCGGIALKAHYAFSDNVDNYYECLNARITHARNVNSDGSESRIGVDSRFDIDMHKDAGDVRGKISPNNAHLSGLPVRKLNEDEIVSFASHLHGERSGKRVDTFHLLIGDYNYQTLFSYSAQNSQTVEEFLKKVVLLSHSKTIGDAFTYLNIPLDVNDSLCSFYVNSVRQKYPEKTLNWDHIFAEPLDYSKLTSHVAKLLAYIEGK
jgi:hypothetical protein